MAIDETEVGLRVKVAALESCLSALLLALANKGVMSAEQSLAIVKDISEITSETVSAGLSKEGAGEGVVRVAEEASQSLYNTLKKFSESVSEANDSIEK